MNDTARDARRRTPFDPTVPGRQKRVTAPLRPS